MLDLAIRLSGARLQPAVKRRNAAIHHRTVRIAGPEAVAEPEHRQPGGGQEMRLPPEFGYHFVFHAR
jgi:hypothetical protein